MFITPCTSTGCRGEKCAFLNECAFGQYFRWTLVEQVGASPSQTSLVAIILLIIHLTNLSDSFSAVTEIFKIFKRKKSSSLAGKGRGIPVLKKRAKW